MGHAEADDRSSGNRDSHIASTHTGSGRVSCDDASPVVCEMSADVNPHLTHDAEYHHKNPVRHLTRSQLAAVKAPRTCAIETKMVIVGGLWLITSG